MKRPGDLSLILASQGAGSHDRICRSFWMGGFEGADHVTGTGAALDMVAAHGHLEQLESDHRRAASLGLHTVRESVGWRLAEPAPGVHDFTRMLRVARSARRHGLEVLWTLMHYGTPADLSLFDPALGERFASFAGAAARALADHLDAPPVFNPINEISFLAWGATSSRLFHGCAPSSDSAEGSSRTSGYALKRRLVSASLQAIAAIRRVIPASRFLHVEPVVHVVAPDARPDLDGLAEEIADYQWQAWDLLTGRAEPELGGHPDAMHLLGVNYYASGQWEADTEARLEWPADPRRRPLHALLRNASARYGRPLIVAETSHVGSGRVDWLDHAASEVGIAIDQGVPVHGICLYPLIDRPDWDDPGHWHHSGLFDVDAGTGRTDEAARPSLRRILNRPYADALARWQQVLPLAHRKDERTCLVVYSHLRWNSVWQRPHQVMSRLAGPCRVMYVEEPVFGDGASRLAISSHGPDLEVLVPHLPRGSTERQAADAVGAMIDARLRAVHIGEWIAWLQTPLALPCLQAMNAPRAVVYECIDDLSAFRGASPSMRDIEDELLRAADLVVTSGPALQAFLRDRHAGVHRITNGVDGDQFDPASLEPGSVDAVEAARLMAAIARPRLGYFGVIDERMDLDLVSAIAAARPHWQLVFCGPVVKIDPSSLPVAPNIHWCGPQPHAVLPYLAAAWDVCLIPFLLDATTRLQCPVKALEYLATGKPTVSVPLPDLLRLYGDQIHMAHGPRAFIAACEHALAAPAVAPTRPADERRELLRAHSWNRVAQSLLALLAPWLRPALATACTDADAVSSRSGLRGTPVAGEGGVEPGWDNR